MTRPLTLCLAAAALLVTTTASAQAPQRDRVLRRERGPRRQFVTISIDGMNTMPLHFTEYPLEELTGKELSATFNEAVDYRSKDGLTTVDVIRFRRRNAGGGITVYPLGAGNGASLAIRGSFERLPEIKFEIDGPGGIEQYQLRDGRAVDVGVGLVVHDRSLGWGLGSHTFVLGGIGKITGERGNGARYFGEGGGGLNVGPIGVELGVKFAYNKLKDPRAHSFFSVPISLRGTVSF